MVFNRARICMRYKISKYTVQYVVKIMKMYEKKFEIRQCDKKIHDFI